MDLLDKNIDVFIYLIQNIGRGMENQFGNCIF